MHLSTRIAAAATACGVSVLFASSAMAAAITPSYGAFGPLVGATFGGNGIPSDPVATTTLGNTVLGLTAHQRFDAPALTNDGAGTFFAMPGLSAVAPSPANPYALWNVGFYIGSPSAGVNYAFTYDFNPAAGNDVSTHRSFTFPALTGTTQDSYNMGMDFLALASPGIGTFDPTVNGEYTFRLEARAATGASLGSTSIRVNVGANAVPEPTSLALVGAALALLGATGASKRRKG